MIYTVILVSASMTHPPPAPPRRISRHKAMTAVTACASRSCPAVRRRQTASASRQCLLRVYHGSVSITCQTASASRHGALVSRCRLSPVSMAVLDAWAAAMTTRGTRARRGQRRRGSLVSRVVASRHERGRAGSRAKRLRAVEPRLDPAAASVHEELYKCLQPLPAVEPAHTPCPVAMRSMRPYKVKANAIHASRHALALHHPYPRLSC